MSTVTCAEALARFGKLEIFHTDQRNQSTSLAFTGTVEHAGSGRPRPLGTKVDQAVKEVLARARRIDVLINNAGVASAGVTEAFTPDQAAGSACGLLLRPLPFGQGVDTHLVLLCAASQRKDGGIELAST
jgi:NAD(P)-dependent dehydrogenase (short-subunit alcohol dehydrogenase family)